MKRTLLIITVLAIMFSGYGQYYQNDNNKTVKNLPSVSSMEKPKPAPKPVNKPVAAKPTTSQHNTQAEYQNDVLVIHDTVYMNMGNGANAELQAMLESMLGNSFIEMKLSNFSASRYTIGVLRNQGFVFLTPLPAVFAGQKNYNNSKECYDNLEKVEYRLINHLKFDQMDKSFVTTNYAPDFLNVTMPDKFTNGGVQLRVPNGMTNGLMVWFVKNSNSEPVEMVIEPQEIVFSSQGRYKVDQPSSPNVIAGAFISFLTDNPGEIGVVLYAMAEKRNNQWELVKVTSPNGATSDVAPAVNNKPSTSSSTSNSSSRSGSERGGGNERGGGR